MEDNNCITCGTYLYSFDDGRDGIDYLCPKCEYEDLPRHIMERCPEFRTKNICQHFYWKDNCKACKMEEAGREDTQGLIKKDLLLEPTIEDLQLKHKEAMHKFVIKRTG